ncbi:MAG: MipA/OmpV family protein [Thiothrix sp.]|nr:MipA/OmpV family protein [Thiothrix sp.]
MKRWLLLILSGVLVPGAGAELKWPDNVGLALEWQQSPFVGGEVWQTVRPMLLDKDGLAVSWPYWSFAEFSAGAVYLGLGLDEWDHRRGDSAALGDMKALDRALNGRLGVALRAGDGVFSLELGQDLLAHKGAQAKLRYAHDLVLGRVHPFAELQWLSADMADYYVGVNADEVTVGRPAYQAGDALGLKAGVTFEYPLTRNLTVLGGVGLTGWDSAVTDSPIVDRDVIWDGYAGLNLLW